MSARSHSLRRGRGPEIKQPAHRLRPLLVWFHAGEEADEAVISGVHELVQPMIADKLVRHAALWQRRLGVMAWGYELHCALEGGVDSGDLVEWMHGRPEFMHLASAAHMEIGFLLKEFLA